MLVGGRNSAVQAGLPLSPFSISRRVVMRIIACTWTIVSTFVLSSFVVLAQGDLNPPGAPAPTLKTLQQVEPRIDLGTLPGTSSNHVQITKPGSYYMSSNMVVTKEVGIAVLNSNVTVDLNGFEIRKSFGGFGDGIRIGYDVDNVSIRNGSIIGHPLSPFSRAINEPDFIGEGAEGLHVDGVRMAYCNEGIRAGRDARIENCYVSLWEQNAIITGFGSTVKNCTITDGDGVYGMFLDGGSIVSQCNLFSNDVFGALIYVGIEAQITDCLLSQNIAEHGIRGGRNAQITSCTVVNNDLDYGIEVGSYSTVKDCLLNDITGRGAETVGILASDSVIENCVVRDADHTNSTTTATQGIGIDSGNRGVVKGCKVAACSGDGILFGWQSTIVGNTADGNGYGASAGAGLRAESASPGLPGSRIDGNTMIANRIGLVVENTGNFIVKNVVGNSVAANYEIVASNFVGKIYSPSNSYAITGGSITGAVGVVGVGSPTAFGSAVADDSWANFSF